MTKTLRTYVLHSAKTISPSLFNCEKEKIIISYSKRCSLIGRRMLWSTLFLGLEICLGDKGQVGEKRGELFVACRLEIPKTSQTHTFVIHFLVKSRRRKQKSGSQIPSPRLPFPLMYTQSSPIKFRFWLRDNFDQMVLFFALKRCPKHHWCFLHGIAFTRKLTYPWSLN